MGDYSMIQQLRQQLFFDEQEKQAQAAVLIAITKEEDPKILLTRRSIWLKNHAGEIAFPGGKRDPEDENNCSVALREAHEETALNPYEVQLIGDLPMQQTMIGVTVKPIVGLIEPQVQLIAQPTEIDRIFFGSVKEMMTAPTIPHAVQLAEKKLYFPSMLIENEVVWGLTARIIVSLFEQGLNYHKEWPLLLK